MAKTYWKREIAEGDITYWVKESGGVIAAVRERESEFTIYKDPSIAESQTAPGEGAQSISEQDYEDIFNEVDRLGSRPSTHPPG